MSSHAPRNRLSLVGVLFAVSGFCLGSLAQSPARDPSPVFYAGERLQYKVSWLFVRLGTIVITTQKLPTSGSGDQYLVRLRVTSNPAIFFVDVNNEYESVISASAMKPVAFTAREFTGSDTIVTQYSMDTMLRQIKIIEWSDPGHTNVQEKVIDSVDVFYEGVSMFFLARSLIHSTLTLTVPTLVSFDLFDTDITFTQKVEAVSIDAMDDEIDAKELYGFAHFVESSLAGLSGDFEGWFTNDEAAIPVVAKMQLTVGTANIELEEWSRGSWSPPPFRESK